MRSHVSSPAECLATNIAMVVLDARMGQHVLGEIPCGIEALLTQRTYLIPYAQVDLLVGLEVAQSGELF